MRRFSAELFGIISVRCLAQISMTAAGKIPDQLAIAMKMAAA
jgi:hypothetical protein